MSRGNGKRYEETFKKETVAQTARETGVNENTLHGWIKKYGQKPDVKAVQTFSTPEAERKAMEKQIRDLQEENEILKKAMHYFAKSPR